MSYLQRDFKSQFLINGFKQGMGSVLKYCLRAAIVEYSIRSYGGFVKQISKSQNRAKRWHCNFDFINKIEVRSNNVRSQTEIWFISFFFFYLGNNRYCFRKHWSQENDQYVAMCAIRYKCSIHFCCYSFFPIWIIIKFCLPLLQPNWWKQWW